MMKRTAARPVGEARRLLEAALDEARSLAAYLLPGWKYQCDHHQRASRWEAKLRGEMKWLDQYSDAELGRRWRDRAGEAGEEGEDG